MIRGTDEDARQAFNRNDGQIKGIQIKLMLSSRQEMQRVIEQARNQSMAAFMLPSAAQTPLPAAVPQVAPAPVPDIRDSRDSDRSDRKRGRRHSRSRSKSRDREKKDRSRDRKDRKHRDRSRSRSRDRRDRRRRERSRSRNRSRSRERRRDRSPKRERNDDNGPQRGSVADVWSRNQAAPAPFNVSPVNDRALLGAYGIALPKHNMIDHLTNAAPRTPISNGFQQNQAFGLREPDWSSSANPQANNSQTSDKAPMSQSSGPRSNLFKRNQMNFFENKNQQGGPPRKPHFANDDPSDLPVNTCISMEPFYGSYGDLRRFFNGLSINYKGIKVINDEFGHKTGICFVQFREAPSKVAALKMNGQKLNNIEVKIEPISDQAFEEAVDRYHPRMDNYGGRGEENAPKFKNISKYFNNGGSGESPIKEFTCLKIEDLPTYVKEQDILHIFSQHPLISLHLNTKPRGGSVAYVKFGAEQVAREALEERANHVIAGKSVTVRPCKDDEFERISKEQSALLDASHEAPLNTDCLSLSNLPTKTTDRDVSDFFSDIGIVPTGIHLVSNNLGFTGNVYCEFESPEQAQKALAKNNASLGPNNITVAPVTRQKMKKALSQTPTVPEDNPEDDDVVAIGPPMLTNENDNYTMNQNMNMPFNMPQPLFMRPPMMRGRGGRGGRFMGRGRGGGPRFNPHMKEHNFEDAPPGCTVYMDNVPYKAGTDEILDFFDGYNCTKNVSRRYNANNTPSAEAKVGFHSPDDAFRAVRDLRGKKIWDRIIYLKQV
ncbi:hypothetical protein GWI33_013978 [Rhynchophorus ferrugineus]|uniref:RRM domain-containing protein n=1 Tax=Rhynchophorus ferrugineus TaxID=354439 RepID=A0A834IG02_RHYFE|nr:hypothetical protein GWI33_013978 [Rhynchophorus ferrugineus]